MLVENVTSDGDFINFMIAAFKRAILRDAYTSGWLALAQMGGFGECEKLLVHLRKQSYGPARIFVIVDSDRLFPGHVTRTIEKVVESCQAVGVPFAVLQKRKIENYLPLSILQQIERVRFRAYLTLQP